MNDDYLREPDRLRVFKALTDCPVGSLRKWAKEVGWTNGKMQRFMNSLARRGLAEFTPCVDGTQFRSLIGSSRCSDSTGRKGLRLVRAATLATTAGPERGDIGPIQGASTPAFSARKDLASEVSSKEADAVHRCSASGASVPRARGRDLLAVNPVTGLTKKQPRVKTDGLRKIDSEKQKLSRPEPTYPVKHRWPTKADHNPDGPVLIAVLNRGMSEKFADWRPVSASHWPSHRTANLLLVEHRIPLEDAKRLVWRATMMYDHAKNPSDRLPNALGYFSRHILAEWRRLQRDRAQGEIFAPVEVDRIPAYDPEPEGRAVAPATLAAVMADFRAEFERAAADPDAVRATNPQRRER